MESIVYRSKNISHPGDPCLESFVQVEGHHLKLSSGLPFVLPMNGGQILVHVVEQLQTQKRQDDVPAILYVEPGPNVSTLDSGAYFTVFICGTLFLVQVLRVLRKPNKAVAIDLPSQSSAGPAIPESESLRESSCTGSGSLPSPAGSPQLRFCTPDATFQVQRPNRDLDPSPSSVEEDDCILVGPPLSMQAPIPNRVVDSELLSSDYGWTRTTSPLPLTLQDENGSPSRVLCDTAPRAQLDSVRDSFVCPLRTPDTPGQPKTESLAAQYGSLLARGRSEISEQEIDEAHKLTQLWPTPFLPAVGASELRKNVTPTAGSPTSSLEAGLSSKMRLSRILGPAFSQGPEGSRKYTSFKPDLDPKVSVVNGNGGGSCHSPLPAPIGTGRPLGTPSPLPVGQPFLNSSSGLLPNSFGGQPFSPFPRRVDSTRRECSAVSRRADLPTVGTVLNPFIALGPCPPTTFLQPSQPFPLRASSPFLPKAENLQSSSLCHRCNRESQSRLLPSLIPLNEPGYFMSY